MIAGMYTSIVAASEYELQFLICNKELMLDKEHLVTQTTTQNTILCIMDTMIFHGPSLR